MLSGIRLKQKVTQSAAKLRAVGNVSRLSVVYMLRESPQTLPDLIRRLKLSPSLVDHHMKILQHAGWVTRSKFGKLVTYYLVEDALKGIVALLK